MKVSYKWLKDFVDLSDIDPYELADRLTNSGLEVEETYPVASGTNLVIGKILECKDHPDSDHLKVTKVDIGDEVLDIVCGAPNCREGLKVIVAKVGAKLPGGEIKAGKIRGVVSNGMLCSLTELGVDRKQLTDYQINGIEELKDDAVVGDTKVLEYLHLDDVILDAKPTPNRPDLLSIFGVAKEVGAVLKREVRLPDYKGMSEKVENAKTSFVLRSETDKCKLFNGKVVNHVVIKPSPDFIIERLHNSGIKAINNVVDISNYVMLETGQPLHFYDLHKLERHEITVRDGYKETYKALDNQDYDILPEDIVITQDGKITGIAGVMGGDDSKIDEETKGIFIEAAVFDGPSIRNTSRRLNLVTEAAGRFSKGIEPLNPFKAVDRAVDLLVKYAEADGFEENVLVGERVEERHEVRETLDHLNLLLGTDFTMDEVLETLNALDFDAHNEGNEIICNVPSYRQDIAIREDLDEEVIRLRGFDRLLESSYDYNRTVGSLNPKQKLLRKIKSLLNAEGFDEIMTYTLVDDEFIKDGVLSNKDPYELLSPISAKRQYIRESLMPSILEVVAYNEARKIDKVNVFEIANTYPKGSEEVRLGIALSNDYIDSKVLKYLVNGSFYTLKGILQSIFERIGLDTKAITFAENDVDHAHFYPHKSALIKYNGENIGILGYIHPDVADKYDVEELTYCELLLNKIIEAPKQKVGFKSIDRYPSSDRDLAIVVKDEVSASELIAEIRKTSDLVVKADIFDIYKGEHIPEGYKSVAVNIVYQSSDHTLNDQEVSEAHNRITEALNNKFEANIRK